MNGVANGLYGGDLPNQINTPWIDFSQQSTIVGWSSFTGIRYRYKVVGNIVYVNIAISGTSNSTSTTFTLPILPKFNATSALGFTTDSVGGFNAGGYITALANNLTVTPFRPTSSTNSALISTWTASGIKEISGELFYEI
jgi:hypothetical protein